MPANEFFDDDLEIIVEFVDESESELAKAANLCLEMEKDPANVELVQEIFRPVHSVKGNSAFLGLLRMRSLAHEMETVLDDFRKQRLTPHAAAVNALLAGFDELKVMLERVRNRKPEVEDDSSFEAVVARVKANSAEGVDSDASATAAAQPKIVRPEPSQSPAAARPGARPAPEPKVVEQPKPAAAEALRTVRIRETFLATFQSLVERLGAFNADLAGLAKTQESVKPHVENMSKILGDIERLSFDMRCLPMGDLLQRVPRMVRDLATAIGKKINVSIKGEDIIVPRKIIEVLETPLVQIIRNAVDHGVEQPGVRLRLGKPPEGRIWVEASEHEDSITLRIADDGGGIDFKTLLRKAMAAGLCPKDRSMTPEDVMNLIFVSGISAARTVTDVSGRGVGMDIVKSQVETAGGKILVASKANQGTEFTLRLPKKQ